MKIVACDNAANAVAGYVSYMKQFGFDKNKLINSKNTMLNYLRGFINRELENKRNLEPEWKTCFWRDGYTPMTWYFTLYFLPQHRLVVIMAFYAKESKPGVKENREVVRLTESKIRKIVEKSVRGILKELYEPVYYLGNYMVINGLWESKTSDSLKEFGTYNDIRMYFSNENTYCLLRRENNGTFFFAEIIPAPELGTENGKKKTKYEPRRPSEVPKNILQDAQALLRSLKS